MAHGTFLGRQPIVDREQRVVAYELLFRASATAQSAEFEEVSRASVRVMVNTFASLGMRAVLGDALGFFNVDRSVLLSETIEALPAERVVIEILETVEVDETVLERCRALQEKGFQLALDDWIVGDPRDALLPFARIVKLDLPAIDPRDLRRLVRELRRFDLLLLAEKVETVEEFETCRKLGFDWYQGYFFARPSILEGAEVDSTQAILIRVLQLISSEADTHEIVDALKQDVKLGLNLLRLTNTAGMASRMRFDTIEDTVRYMGLDRLRRWVTILLFAQGDAAGLRSPLLLAAAHRGCLMERIAAHVATSDAPGPQRERAFMVGMLSMADALLRLSMSDLVRELRLSGPVASALTERGGDLGDLLGIVESIEKSDVEKFEPDLARWDLDLESLQEVEHAAYAWVHGLLNGSDGDGEREA